MGATKESGTNVVWLSINGKTSTLSEKRSGEDPKKIPGFESHLVEVDFVAKPANLEHEIPAHNVYRLIFEDADSGELTRYALELKEGQSITNNFINSLCGLRPLEAGRMIYFRVYEKGGNTNIYLAESQNKDADKLEWGFGWLADERWFDGVPRPIELNELDDKGNVKKDYTPVTLFWRNQFLNVIYPAINGKPWSAPRDEQKTIAIKNRLLSVALDQSPEKMESIWGAQNKWLDEQLASVEDRLVVKAALREQYIKKGGKKTLQDNGLISDGLTTEKIPAPAKETQAPAAPKDPLDDLPF